MRRVNVLFVHDLNVTQKRRLFAKITSTQHKKSSVVDECLSLSILKLRSSVEIDHVFVDLSSIHAEKLYMISINIDDQASISVTKRSRLRDSINSDVL